MSGYNMDQPKAKESDGIAAERDALRELATELAVELRLFSAAGYAGRTTDRLLAKARDMNQWGHEWNRQYLKCFHCGMTKLDRVNLHRNDTSSCKAYLTYLAREKLDFPFRITVCHLGVGGQPKRPTS